MRQLILGCAVLFGAGCASVMNARPPTVFAPLPNEGPQPADQGPVAVTVVDNQPVKSHSGCYAIQRQNGAGVIHCDYGTLEWVITDKTQGVDDFDILRDAAKADAAKENSTLEDTEVKCNMAGAPATCRSLVFTPKDGSTNHTTLIGMALTGRALVAQCVAAPNQNNAMQPVCAEAIELK